MDRAGTTGMKNKTLRNIASALRIVLDRAVNDEHIDHNPFDKVKLRQLLPRSQPGTSAIVDPFTNPEKRAIVRAAANPSVKNMVTFMFDTGARVSETFGLRPEDIDLKHGTLKIRRAVVLGIEKSTKTSAGTRELKLFPAALLALEDQLKLGPSNDGYVFWHPETRDGWKHDANFRKSYWKPLLQQAGVRYRYPYQARHTFATGLLEAGAPIAYVSKYLGHTTSEMTIRHYIRSRSDINLPSDQIPNWMGEQ
jgi:integrase